MAEVPRSWRNLSDIFKRPRVVEALTVNDDFTDRLSDIPDLLATRRPAFGGAQEVKRTNVTSDVRALLGWRYGVLQDRRHEGAAGVAVFWDRLVCRATGKTVDDPERIGCGWVELTPAGDGLLSRGVVWQDVVIRVGWVAKARIRVASTHRPPGRDDHLWPAFDTALAEFVHDSPLPLVIVLDCNEAGGPVELVRLSGLSWRGAGIDGVLTDLPVPEAPKALERRRSDHHAVSIPIRL